MTVGIMPSSHFLARLSEEHEHDSEPNAQMEDLLHEARRYHPNSPKAPLRRPAPEQHLPPVVLVEGFFSFFNEFFWGPIETHLNASRSSKGFPGNRRIIFARCGPVSSMHDRACELYYTIKGGTVDYGEEHAKQHGHSRYGRTFDTPHYPSWSLEHPIHFVAHSLGGTTVTVLQSLIAEGHFPGAHPDMISSLSTVGAPFKGSSFAYLLGKSYENSVDTRFFSVDSFITKNVHMLSWFKPLIPSWAPLPDWFADARNLSMGDQSIFSLMKQLWKSDWGEGRDVISFDSTFEGCRLLDEQWQDPGPNTYYRSYVCCMTKREKPYSSYHVPTYKSPLVESIFLYTFSTLVGKFDYRTVRPLPYFYKPGPPPRPTLAPHLTATEDFNKTNAQLNGFVNGTTDREELVDSSLRAARGPTGTRVDLGEDFYANDGVVPLFSQWHPGPCGPSRCLHHSTLHQPHPSPFFFGLPPDHHSHSTSSVSKTRRARAAMKPGIWNVCHIPDSTHVSFMPLWVGTQRQKEFWIEIGEWLERVDDARENSIGMDVDVDADTDLATPLD